jgi:hypothetical protein
MVPIFLKIQTLKLSFSTAKKLRSLVEILPKAPEWMCKEWDTSVETKNKPLYLFYRNPIEVIKALVCNPLVKNFIDFTPFHIFESAAKKTRIYTEWMSGDAAWSMQVRACFHMQVFLILRFYRVSFR